MEGELARCGASSVVLVANGQAQGHIRRNNRVRLMVVSWRSEAPGPMSSKSNGGRREKGMGISVCPHTYY
jgi:hypothetical protein